MEPKKQRTKKVAKPTQIDWRTDKSEGNKVENLEHVTANHSIAGPGELHKGEVEVDIRENVGRKIPKPKVMKSLQELIPEQDGVMVWEEAKKAAKAGKCIRRVSWPLDQFIWFRSARPVYIQEDKPGGGLTGPITKRFLEARGLKKMMVSSHWDMWIPETGTLQVGWYPNTEAKTATNWRIITI